MKLCLKTWTCQYSRYHDDWHLASVIEEHSDVFNLITWDNHQEYNIDDQFQKKAWFTNNHRHNTWRAIESKISSSSFIFRAKMFSRLSICEAMNQRQTKDNNASVYYNCHFIID